MGEVLREQGLDSGEVTARLDEISARQNRETKDYAAMEPRALSDHIEGKHHSYLREALPLAGALFAKVLKAHGASHPELFEAHRLFGGLRTELEQHLVKEEVQLFPALEGEDTSEAAWLASVIIAEHESAGAVLKQLRHITGDYSTPTDGCATYRRLMELLEELEGDLFQHIHLENNILLREYREKEAGEDG